MFDAHRDSHKGQREEGMHIETNEHEEEKKNENIAPHTKRKYTNKQGNAHEHTHTHTHTPHHTHTSSHGGIIVSVADVLRFGFDAVVDTPEAGGDGCTQCHVRVAVCTGNAALDAEGVPRAHDTEASAAVVGGPGETGGGEGARREALVAVDGGCVQGHQLGHLGHPAGQEVPEALRARLLPHQRVCGTVGVTTKWIPLCVRVEERQMDVTAAARVRTAHLGHEGERFAVLVCMGLALG
jgi:hypothetical protein